MLDYIVSNKEWIFSGVGVLALSGIARVLLRFARPGGLTLRTTGAEVLEGGLVRLYSAGATPLLNQVHESAAVQALPFDHEQYSTTPLPPEILEELDSAPPYQRSERQKHFIGMKVQWKTKLSSVQQGRKGMVLVFLNFGEDHPYTSVFVTVRISKYPALKLAPAGSAVWVCGTIGEVRSLSISLSKAHLKVEL